jgi:hypothetical protein
MNTALSDPVHAWLFVIGVIAGLLVAAGAVAWVVHYISALVREARVVIEEMRKVIMQAKIVALHVAENYAPLRKKVDEIEQEVKDIRDMMRKGDQPR